MMMMLLIVARGVKTAVKPFPSTLETIKMSGRRSDLYKMAMEMVSDRMPVMDRLDLI